MANTGTGRGIGVIADGYIPGGSNGPAPEMRSPESASMLNAGGEDALVTIAICPENRESAGPCRLVIPARQAGNAVFNTISYPALEQELR